MCIFLCIRIKILGKYADHECHCTYLVFMTSYDFRRAPKTTKRNYELRHICLSVCLYVNLFVRMELFDCQWMDIH